MDRLFFAAFYFAAFFFAALIFFGYRVRRNFSSF